MLTDGVVVHLISHAFGPSHPGIYRTLCSVAGSGRHVVLSFGGSAPYGPADEAPATAALPVHQVEHRHLKRPWRVAHLAMGLRQRYGRVAAIVGHLGNNGWRAVPLGWRADAPVVAIFHGTDAMVGLDSSEYGWRYQRLFQAPGSTALCVAEHLTRRVLEAGVPPDRAATFHLGIDLAEYEPPERAPHGSTLRVALVGRLMPVKGHATALRAFAGLARARPGSILELFGEGELEPSLRRLAGELGVADSVHFRGLVPVDVLRQELSRADVALQPSQIDPQGRIEGIPNATLEAMALALPVVATRHGGIPEAVRDGETGFLVPERDPAALEGRLMELAAAPERRLEMGRAARKRIEEEFALGAQGRHLSKHLERAARRYDQIPADTRRHQWRLATPGLLDRSGRRDRARWWALTQLNRIRGRVP